MLVTFEVMEKEGELVAVHDGALGVLVAFGYDWDMLRDMVNEAVASSVRESSIEIEIEIELFIDENHRTRFRHHYDLAVADRIRSRLVP